MRRVLGLLGLGALLGGRSGGLAFPDAQRGRREGPALSAGIPVNTAARVEDAPISFNWPGKGRARQGAGQARGGP
jgi:hypothetical protein